MRGPLRLALGALALAALAIIGCRTSALHPLYQTSNSTGSSPVYTPPITLPAPSVPGESIPRPAIPTTPQVAETTSFLDGGSLLGGTGGAGLTTPGTMAYDAGSFSSLGAPGSTGIGAPGSTGIGGAGTSGFSPFSPDGGTL